MSQQKEVVLFVDMDGVIADYAFKEILDFKNKRPITTNINTLEEISKLENVELHILPICKKDYQIEEKNAWLDKHAPYFKEERRIIISKESKPNFSSKQLKLEALKEQQVNYTNKKIVVVDDDFEILNYLFSNLKDITFFQDSSIID